MNLKWIETSSSKRRRRGSLHRLLRLMDWHWGMMIAVPFAVTAGAAEPHGGEERTPTSEKPAAVRIAPIEAGGNVACLEDIETMVQPVSWTGRLPPHEALYAGYWSDKLALTPYRDYFSLGDPARMYRLAAQLLNQSFDIAGASAEEASRRITEAVKGGISIFGGSTITMFGMTRGGVVIDVSTAADIQTDIPEAPFLIMFSDGGGLRHGSDLPLTHCAVRARIRTDITASSARPAAIPGVVSGMNRMLWGLTDFSRAVWCYGLTVTMGNAFIDMGAESGGIHMSDDGTRLYVDASTASKSSGIGIVDKKTIGLSLKNGFPVAGLGAGVNAGIVMYGEHASLSAHLFRIGPMVWKDIREETMAFRTRNLSIAEFLDGNFDMFDSGKGGAFRYSDTDGATPETRTLLGWEPARLNLDFGYRWSTEGASRVFRRVMPKYISASMDFEQNLVSWPGRSLSPWVALGAEIGFFSGMIPLRLGCGLGGAKGIASSLSLCLDRPLFSLTAGYEAIGTPYWFPKRGCGVFLGFRTR